MHVHMGQMWECLWLNECVNVRETLTSTTAGSPTTQHYLLEAQGYRLIYHMNSVITPYIYMCLLCCSPYVICSITGTFRII